MWNVGLKVYSYFSRWDSPTSMYTQATLSRVSQKTNREQEMANNFEVKSKVITKKWEERKCNMYFIKVPYMHI